MEWGQGGKLGLSEARKWADGVLARPGSGTGGNAGRLVPASALALRSAHHAVGDHRLDVGCGIAELAEHLGRVLAECRWCAAQAWLRACQPDRRGHTLVPILLDNIAAVECVRTLQRLIDFLHRAGRQSRREQTVAERFRLMLAEHRRELLAQRVAVGDAVLVARKTGIRAESGLADLLAELAEGAVIAYADEDVVGARREDRIRHEVRMLVAGQRWRLAMHEIIRGMRVHDGK